MNIPCRVRSSETRNFSGSQKTRLSCVRQDELVELRMPWTNIDLRLVHIWALHPSPPWYKMSMMAQAQFLSFGFVDQQHPLKTCWKWQLWTPPQTGWIRLCTNYPSDLQVHHSPMTLSFPLISSSCPTLKYSHPKTLKGIRSFLGFPCFTRWSLPVIRNLSPALLMAEVTAHRKFSGWEKEIMSFYHEESHYQTTQWGRKSSAAHRPG